MFGLPALIKRRVYEAPNPVSEVARFEREVAEAACEGGSVALEIWVDAAREVAAQRRRRCVRSSIPALWWLYRGPATYRW